MFINWTQVFSELTPTHILVALAGYIIVHALVRLLKLVLLITKGAALSDTRKAIAYMHGRQGHTEKFGECVVGEVLKPIVECQGKGAPHPSPSSPTREELIHPYCPPPASPELLHLMTKQPAGDRNG